MLIEVCVDSVESAVAAERGGGGRVELCSDLVEGGVTPSAGMIAAVRAKITIPVHVMIRPRGGDFLYSADEFEIMKRDIPIAKDLGANGVALGILDAAGNVDVARVGELVAMARPMSVTFHRAFDMTADLPRALQDAKTAGVDRVLTSGGEATAAEGEAMLAKIVRGAGDQVGVIACGGIRAGNVRRVIEATGVREVHVGFSTEIKSAMQFRNEKISMGKFAGREYMKFVVLEEMVRGLVRAAESKQVG